VPDDRAVAEGFTWLNPPPVWSGDTTALELETGANTDFWRDTFYGFTRDSGHAWLAPVDSDFTVSVRFRGEYAALYDQAGLMLRGDATTWIKTGIEFTDGLMHFSVVVTGPRSDWSVIPLPEASPATAVAARLTRHGDAVRVQYALGETVDRFGPWRMARLAPFPAGPARAGLMACSPERAGFRVRFEDLAIGPPIDRRLHD
jgi:regulation of enolase protein 1 (concanavalin A-like superfamily)